MNRVGLDDVEWPPGHGQLSTIVGTILFDSLLVLLQYLKYGNPSWKTLIANWLPTAILNSTHNRTKLEYRKTHSGTLLTQALTRIKLPRPCDTFPTFQLQCCPFTDQNFVSSDYKFALLDRHHNKRYSFNFCPCLSWTRLSNFSFCMQQHLSFRTTTFRTFAFASTLSQPLALQCFHFVQLSALSLSLWLSFPFDYSTSHFFHPLICFFYFLFVSSCSIQFRRTPKSRRRDPCSKGFREVTHRLLYLTVC